MHGSEGDIVAIEELVGPFDLPEYEELADFETVEATAERGGITTFPIVRDALPARRDPRKTERRMRARMEADLERLRSGFGKKKSD